MEMRYIELKTGYNDNGPAWIGKVKLSKSGQMIYFNDVAFQKFHGTYSNYCNIETGDEYWISNVKKDGTDRHWAGSGKILVGRDVLSEYLKITGQETLNQTRYEVIDIEESYPVERIKRLKNGPAAG